MIRNFLSDEEGLMPLEWRFSRNQHRHWVEDGKYYGKNFERLFVIQDCRPHLSIHLPEHGYDLYRKGKKVAHAKNVKALKLKAETLR